MKPKLAFLVLILAALACALPGAATPTAVPLPPTATQAPTLLLTETPAPLILAMPLVESPAILRLHMLDAFTGWAIQEQILLRTIDGGATWRNVSMPNETALGYSTELTTLGADQAWVLVPDSADPLNAGTLYRTEDGGLNWIAIPTPFGSARLDFVDFWNGWAMVDLGVAAGSMGVAIYQTDTGGVTWRQVYTNDPTADDAGDSLPLSGLKNNLVAASMQTAWVGGVIYAPGVIYLYQTRDGGQSWAAQSLPIPEEVETSEASTDGPLVLSPAEAILPVRFTGEILQTAFYGSNDGGQTWVFKSMIPGAGSVDFTSALHGIFWSGGKFYTTTDGAQTWNAVTPNIAFGDMLAVMDFADPATGWVVTIDASNQHTLYQTRDGGITWMPIAP
jgi:photosystem II stability/assembly factor-like uncharacterized protein